MMTNDRAVDIGGSISKSAVVTGDHNDVKLTFGDNSVVPMLVRKHARFRDQGRPPRAGESTRELDLLDPECGTLLFVGRQDMMEQLRAWVDTDAKVSVLAVTGRAGSGKTRLALELCKALDPEGRSGTWHAGFLSGSDLAAMVEALATRAFDWTRHPRMLVVLDNAAQCHRALARWLDRLADEPIGEARLRILLLEREAPQAFGWWFELWDGPMRRGRFPPLRPIMLPELDDPGERRELLGAAFEAAMRLRQAPVPGQGPSAMAQPDLDRALAGSQFGIPLNLVMAGVLAPEQGLRAALALRRLDAAQELGKRELERLRGLAGVVGVSADALWHVVAFNALAGGLAVDGLPGVLAAELATAGLRVDNAVALADLLNEELPSRSEDGTVQGEERLGRHRPDLLAEAVTIAVFSGSASRQIEGRRALQRAYALDPHSSAAALMRLLQDFAYAIEDPLASDNERLTAERLMDWLRTLVKGIKDAEALAPIAFALPAQSLVLREVAVEVQTRVAEGLRRQAEQSGSWTDAAASALNNLSNRLGDLGRWEEALQEAQNAVAVRRSLVAAHAEVFVPNLALSLNNLAIRLGNLGHREAALKAAQESVSLYAGLEAVHAGVFKSDLAQSTSNLANTLGSLGRKEEALEMTQRAVDLDRDLAFVHPDIFTPGLAASLTNLAGRLGELDKHQAGLSAAQEAVGLYRALAAERPDAFKPNLAKSLTNLANRLGNVGRAKDALDAASEVVRSYRELANKRPVVFRAELATSLSNLANRLGSLDRPEEALKMAQEAVDLGRALADRPSDTSTSELAVSLRNLAVWLGKLNRRQEAAAAAREAVQLCRGLADRHPDVFVDNLARSLWVFGNRLAAAGEVRAAVEALQEGVILLTPYALSRPAAFGALTRSIIRDYVLRCREAGVEPDGVLLQPLVPFPIQEGGSP